MEKQTIRYASRVSELLLYFILFHNLLYFGLKLLFLVRDVRVKVLLSNYLLLLVNSVML